MWSSLSDERTGLSFTFAADAHQRSHSRVRVSWDSRPYFTVSDFRLPFSSPPTTSRVTVEVFDPSLHTGTPILTSIANAATLYLLDVPNRGHWVEEFSYPLSWKRHLRCAGNVCLRCCENNAYWAVAQQRTVPAGRPGYVYQQAVTYAMDSHVTI
jgi:hypothetical protein